MLVHRRVTPSIKFAGTHLYTWVDGGIVRVKCLAQEHNTMSPARTRTRSTGSGVERANHEDTAPPTSIYRYILSQILAASYSACVVYTKTIIHLSVASGLGKYYLHFGEWEARWPHG